MSSCVHDEFAGQFSDLSSHNIFDSTGTIKLVDTVKEKLHHVWFFAYSSY